MTDSRYDSAKIMDESSFRQKYLTKLMASPFCLVPFLAGITDLLVLWTFSIQSGLGIFAGITGILGAVGIFLTRLLTGDQSVGKDVLDSMEKEALKAREQALDELDLKLTGDGDPRTETCLRDLRVLAQAFTKNNTKTESIISGATLDIFSGVEQLFMHCIHSLEKTLTLWYTADQMTTEEARYPILEQREHIIHEVSESILYLGKILAGIQTLDTTAATHSADLERIRSELNQSLEVAKRVKSRMDSLNQDIDDRRIHR